MLTADAARAQASSRFQVTSSFAAIIGPPPGAPLLFALGVQWASVINAVSFAVSFATIKAMRLPVEAAAVRAQAARFFSEMRAGLRFFIGNRMLVTLTVGVIIATLGTGALNSLNVFFVSHNLGAVNTAVTPLLLAVTPQELIGRVASVIQPVQQLAAIGSMAVAGFLASTALRGFHGTVGGLHFGTYDTISAVAGLLFIAGGLAAVPLRHVDSPATE